jgi:hypothetical protein
MTGRQEFMAAGSTEAEIKKSIQKQLKKINHEKSIDCLRL